MGRLEGMTERRRAELVRWAGAAPTVGDLFGTVSQRLAPLVPFDAAAWLTTDPATGLPTGEIRVEGVEGVTWEQCCAHWRREFIEDDVNLFRDLARAPRPAAALRDTIGDPHRSGRYASFLQPLGFDDELRAVLRVGDAPWGTITLWRREPAPPFSPRERDLIASLSAPLGEALRTKARPDGASPALASTHPGLILFDASGNVVSVNDDARAWLAELPPDPGSPAVDGLHIPLWMMVTVYRAMGSATSGADGTARARSRTRTGAWVVCHASCLRDASGAHRSTALVIEPATATAIAPLVVEAYDLTPREQQVTRLVARGASTSEIARELYVSVHTVRDHLKAIFAKVGVTSRGELVAKLYAELYLTAS